MSASPKPQFSVPLADLEDGDRELECAIPSTWLERALEGTEARARGLDGQLELTLTKAGRDVLVRGRLSAPVQMDCARSLEPIDLEVETDVFLMLAPGSAPAGAGRAPRGARADGASKHSPARSESKTAGNKKRKHPSDQESDDELLSEEDAARDVYVGEEIVLDGFIREFILLELPLFPLRSEDTPHIAPPSYEPGQSSDHLVDPRLAPLAALRDRLRQKE